MFQRIQQYGPIDAGGRAYRPRAYADPQPDGSWKGWLVFFPATGSGAIAPPQPETTQATWTALTTWAAGLTLVYLEGALERALRVAASPPSVIDQLTAAEYEALQDAEQLDVERTVADLDEAAAKIARDEADEIRQERLATERALAAAEEAAANVDAAIHEEAARQSRDAAARAAERRRAAEVKGANDTGSKDTSRTKR